MLTQTHRASPPPSFFQSLTASMILPLRIFLQLLFLVEVAFSSSTAGTSHSASRLKRKRSPHGRQRIATNNSSSHPPQDHHYISYANNALHHNHRHRHHQSNSNNNNNQHLMKRSPVPVPQSSSSFKAPSLPGKVLTGYWQNFNNGATPLKLSDVPAEYNLIVVAFADISTTGPAGSITFNLDTSLAGGYTADAFKSDIAALASQGRFVILSVGGQNGQISITSSAAAAAFAQSAFSLMTTYGFTGIDIDLENGIDAVNLALSLQTLNSLAPGYILTLAPQTLDVQPGHGYLTLMDSIKSLVTICNTQYYNSGTMFGQDGKVYAESTVDFMTALADILIGGGHLQPSQVGLGLPASPSAAGSGYVDPSLVNNALDCLASGANCGSYIPKGKYPDIRGAMTWSISWDASNAYNFGKTVGNHLASMSGQSPPPQPSPASSSSSSSAATATTATMPKQSTSISSSSMLISTTSASITPTFTSFPIPKPQITTTTTTTTTTTVSIPKPSIVPASYLEYKLPGKTMLGYWLNYISSNSPPPLKLSQVHHNYNLISIISESPVYNNMNNTGSSGNSDQSGTINFTLDAHVTAALGGYSASALKADIATLKNQNRLVLLAISTPPTGVFSAAAFADSVSQLMNNYGFAGIDLAVHATDVQAANMYAAAIKQLVMNRQPGAIIVLSPIPSQIEQNLKSHPFLDLLDKVPNHISLVATQVWNMAPSGSSSVAVTASNGKKYTPGSIEYIVALADELIGGGHLAASQVALGVKASSLPGFPPSSYMAADTLNQALECLISGSSFCGSYIPSGKYPDIGGVAIWSVNSDGDAACGASRIWSFATNVGKKLASTQGAHLLANVKRVFFTPPQEAPASSTTTTTKIQTISQPSSGAVAVSPATPSSPSCSTTGIMQCSGTGFNTCVGGAWIYRTCAPGTSCKPSSGSIICS